MANHNRSYFDDLHKSVSTGLQQFSEWVLAVTPSDGVTLDAVRAKLHELVPRLDEFHAAMAEWMEAQSASKTD